MPVCVIICNLRTNIGHPDITPLVGVSDMCFLPCCDTTALEIGTCKKSVPPFPKGRFPESVEEENFRETGYPRYTFKMTDNWRIVVYNCDNWRIVHTYMHLYCTQCRAQGLNLYIHVYTLCLRKKQDTKLLPITSPNVNRFSKFFHWLIHW